MSEEGVALLLSAGALLLLVVILWPLFRQRKGHKRQAEVELLYKGRLAPATSNTYPTQIRIYYIGLLRWLFYLPDYFGARNPFAKSHGSMGDFLEYTLRKRDELLPPAPQMYIEEEIDEDDEEESEWNDTPEELGRIVDPRKQGSIVTDPINFEQMKRENILDYNQLLRGYLLFFYEVCEYNNGVLSRDPLIDAKHITISRWNYLIGSEKSNTIGPGLFRRAKIVGISDHPTRNTKVNVLIPPDALSAWKILNEFIEKEKQEEQKKS